MARGGTGEPVLCGAGSVIAGPPQNPVPVPPTVLALAGELPVRAVWENQIGGVTFEICGEGDRRFIKWAPAGTGVDLQGEAARLSWAAPYTAVPTVLDCGADESGNWLMTEALPGESAVTDRWKLSPKLAVSAVGEGLRALHEALPIVQCPFSWSAEARLVAVRRGASLGQLDPATWHSDHHGLSVHEALEALAVVPDIDHAVVCHGDACAPNTLIAADGRCSGHVDFGAMGVGDRWADLAVATWSTRWNYGPGWEQELLAAYGVKADIDRIRYYRLLSDLGPE